MRQWRANIRYTHLADPTHAELALSSEHAREKPTTTVTDHIDGSLQARGELASEPTIVIIRARRKRRMSDRQAAVPVACHHFPTGLGSNPSREPRLRRTEGPMDQEEGGTRVEKRPVRLTKHPIRAELPPAILALCVLPCRRRESASTEHRLSHPGQHTHIDPHTLGRTPPGPHPP